MKTPPAIGRFLDETLKMDEDAVGKGAVSRAVQEAMREEGVSDPHVYEALFVSSPEVRQRFINAVVVGETWFFRDRGPFTSLARHARGIKNDLALDVLKVLSVPCASGEEPYSIVMTLLNAGFDPASFSIDGVDISTRALDSARRACYGNSSFRGNLGEEFAGFFETTPRGRLLSRQVVGQVAFHQANLLAPGCLSGQGPYAVIFCRNLLIYMTSEARREVFERLDRLLLPGGVLFSGHTETIFWHQQGYSLLPWDRSFALTKPVSSPVFKKSQTANDAKPFPPTARSRKIPVPTESCRRSEDRALEAKAADVSSTAAVAAEQKKGVDPFPESVKPFIDGQFQEARRLADQGLMERAMELCRECLQKNGPAVDIYCLMGIIHMAGQNLKDAEDCFLKALYLDPANYESLVHISFLYRQKGDQGKAALYMDRADRQVGRQENSRENAGTHSLKQTVENDTAGNMDQEHGK
jgi:chemotaxis protein methyltransferase WspC